MTNQSCLISIQSKFKTLTQGEKKVAKYVLENYKSILDYTVTELSEKAKSSDATVVRFCKSVGFKGFQDFKISIARDVIVPYKHINPILEKGDTTSEIIHKMIHSEIAVLEETLNILNANELDRGASAIVKAKRVDIYGSGGSAYVSKDAMHKFLKIGVRCFSQTDADIQAMEASLLNEGDVALGISHSGCNKNVIDCLRIARQVGALTIGLTTQGKSPMLKYCDMALFTSTRETVFKSESVTARIAQLAVIDALVATVAFMNYEKSYNAIQKTRDATANRKY